MAGSNSVQPIRDCKDIACMKAQLAKTGTRDLLLFTLGINTGLRIGDLLRLTVEDIQGSHICIAEQKTGKKKRALINQNLRRLLDEYILGMSNSDYLFPSRKTGKPITRVQAYRILNAAATTCGIPEVGTHTLRKTFGYHHYQQHKDVALLQELFNHSAPSVTLRYIGLNQDLMDQSIADFSL